MSTVAEAARAFPALAPQAPDPVLSLMRAFREDRRADKLDLGVGVYRDDEGETPVFNAVKASEHILWQSQKSKAYIGPEGDLKFLELLRPLIFGPRATEANMFAAQTPGGVGALRLAAELLRAGYPDARLWMPSPTWPIHEPIFNAAGLSIQRIDCFERATQTLAFARLAEALQGAEPGDAVLLHASCHNPTGVDFSVAQWREIANLVSQRGLVPVLDMAYQGLGDGLEEDAAGARIVLEAANVALLAYSCDKNFGLYRERTGALFVCAQGDISIVRSNALTITRGMWSMPPDHGAAIVRTILEDRTLESNWRTELSEQQQRLARLRCGLAAAHGNFSSLSHGKGMFALLPLSPSETDFLREEHGIYMTRDARVNIAGLTERSIPKLAAAYDAVLRTL